MPDSLREKKGVYHLTGEAGSRKEILLDIVGNPCAAGKGSFYIALLADLMSALTFAGVTDCRKDVKPFQLGMSCKGLGERRKPFIW